MYIAVQSSVFQVSQENCIIALGVTHLLVVSSPRVLLGSPGMIALPMHFVNFSSSHHGCICTPILNTNDKDLCTACTHQLLRNLATCLSLVYMCLFYNFYYYSVILLLIHLFYLFGLSVHLFTYSLLLSTPQLLRNGCEL